MKKRQLIGLWVIAIFWAFTILFWYFSNEDGWGFLQFMQATIFWGIFGVLIFTTLGQANFEKIKKKKLIKNTIQEIPVGNSVENMSTKADNLKPSIGNENVVDPKVETNYTKYPVESIEFYAVPIMKLVMLYLCTFSLYQIYWQYKNWKAVRLQTNFKVFPGLRAWFLIIFSYDLFRRILGSAIKNGYERQSSPGLLYLLYVLLSISWHLPGNWWLISFFGFIPLLIVQKAINYNNFVLNPNNVPNEKFSGKEIVILIVGGILILLCLIGTFMPKQ